VDAVIRKLTIRHIISYLARLLALMQQVTKQACELRVGSRNVLSSMKECTEFYLIVVVT
jgi:hypothetical protein